MIFSRTDTAGFITDVNIPFIEASGWEKEELIGQPHYILRHPHMPASAFEDLWATAQAGKQWTGCVKNLRKDGGYYWVRAGPMLRSSAPPFGFSILMTAAPISAIIMEQNGPARTLVKSNTTTFDNAPSKMTAPFSSARATPDASAQVNPIPKSTMNELADD